MVAIDKSGFGRVHIEIWVEYRHGKGIAQRGLEGDEDWPRRALTGIALKAAEGLALRKRIDVNCRSIVASGLIHHDRGNTLRHTLAQSDSGHDSRKSELRRVTRYNVGVLREVLRNSDASLRNRSHRALDEITNPYLPLVLEPVDRRSRNKFLQRKVLSGRIDQNAQRDRGVAKILGAISLERYSNTVASASADDEFRKSYVDIRRVRALVSSEEWPRIHGEIAVTGAVRRSKRNFSRRWR